MLIKLLEFAEEQLIRVYREALARSTEKEHLVDAIFVAYNRPKSTWIFDGFVSRSITTRNGSLAARTIRDSAKSALLRVWGPLPCEDLSVHTIILIPLPSTLLNPKELYHLIKDWRGTTYIEGIPYCNYKVLVQ